MKNFKEILLVVVLLGIVAYFSIILLLPGPEQSSSQGLFSVKGGFFGKKTTPVLVVEDIKTRSLSNCEFAVSGVIKNIGDLKAKDIKVTCNKQLYSIDTREVTLKYFLSKLGESKSSPFTIKYQGNCNEKIIPEFDCRAECVNC